jgi:hypothetical protein
MFFKAIDNSNSAGDLSRKVPTGSSFSRRAHVTSCAIRTCMPLCLLMRSGSGSAFDKQQTTQPARLYRWRFADRYRGHPLPHGRGIEYTRIRPFRLPKFFTGAGLYRHDGYLLGDWMGNNADRTVGFVKYTPLPKLKLQMRYSYPYAKAGAGTLAQQYSDPTQPPFLFDLQQQSDDFLFNASYEYLHRLCFNGYLQEVR